MEHLVQPTLDFISAHSSWAVAVMFVTAFGESFAFVSLLFPGTSLLIAAGTLMAAGSLPYLPIVAGAVVGAVLGDTVSFWIGHRFGGGIARVGRNRPFQILLLLGRVVGGGRQPQPGVRIIAVVIGRFEQQLAGAVALAGLQCFAPVPDQFLGGLALVERSRYRGPSHCRWRRQCGRRAYGLIDRKPAR